MVWWLCIALPLATFHELQGHPPMLATVVEPQARKQVKCPNCKQTVNEAKFCSKCGKPLPPPATVPPKTNPPKTNPPKTNPPTEPAKVYCPNCAEDVPKGRFCLKCGYDFDRATTLEEVANLAAEAWSQYQGANYGDALAKCDRALAKPLTGPTKEFAEAHVIRALALLRLDRPSEADAALKAAEALPLPRNRAFQFGIAFYGLPVRTSEAIRWFSVALEDTPEDANLLDWVGAYYHYKAQDHANAEVFYKRSIAAESHGGNPHFNYARLLRDQSKWKESAAQLTEAIDKHDAKNTGWRNELGYVLYRGGESGRAEEVLRESLRIQDSSTAKLYLAYIKEGQGAHDDAERWYLESLAVSKDKMALCEYGNFLNLHRKNPAEGEAKMREALAMDPKFTHGYQRLITLLEGQGKTEAANQVKAQAAANGVKLG